MFKRIVHALMTGNNVADGIETFCAKHVRFESEDETAWTLDEERCEPTKTINIENVPCGMEFILPKHISFAS